MSPFDDVINALNQLNSTLSVFGLSESSFEVFLFGLAGLVCGCIIVYAFLSNL